MITKDIGSNATELGRDGLAFSTPFLGLIYVLLNPKS